MSLCFRPRLDREVLWKAIPAAAIAGALVMGAASAKAATGSLAFGDGVSDFFLPGIPGPGEMITGTFNPGPDSKAIFTSASGIFSPPFTTAPPSYFKAAIPTDFKFTLASGPVDCGAALQDCIVLSADQVLFKFVNGTEIGLRDGALAYDFFMTPAGGVLFPLPSAADWFVMIPGVSAPIVVTSSILSIADAALTNSGSYSALFEVETQAQTVPGPLPILGAGVALRYSRKIRRRIKLGQTA